MTAKSHMLLAVAVMSLSLGLATTGVPATSITSQYVTVRVVETQVATADGQPVAFLLSGGPLNALPDGTTNTIAGFRWRSDVSSRRSRGSIVITTQLNSEHITGIQLRAMISDPSCAAWSFTERHIPSNTVIEVFNGRGNAGCRGATISFGESLPEAVRPSPGTQTLTYTLTEDQ